MILTDIGLRYIDLSRRKIYHLATAQWRCEEEPTTDLAYADDIAQTAATKEEL